MNNIEYRIGVCNGLEGVSQKAVITVNAKPVILLDARGADTNVENIKKHIERCMRNYNNALEFVSSGRKLTQYTPSPIEYFEYNVSNNRMALLRYKQVAFAQIDLSAIYNDLNTSIKLIYNTAQSYIRYLKSFVDGKDSKVKGKGNKK